MPARILTSLLTAILFALATHWRAPDSRESALRTPLPGETWALDVEDGQCEFVLPAASDSSYVLVLGCLGDSRGEYQVRLDARSCSDRAGCRGTCLKRLPKCERGLAGEPTALRLCGESDKQILSGTAAIGAAEAATRGFWIHVTDGPLDDPRQYTHVVANCVATGNRVRVFLDEQSSVRDLDRGLPEEIVRLFDEEIAARFAQDLGACRDVDGDGKFAVLLTPWLGRLQGGRTSLGGFVRSDDFRGELAPPLSNHGDVMYVNSSVKVGPKLKTLLTHEYTHAVCFSRRMSQRSSGGALPPEEDWLNEAIAHVIEDLHGTGFSNLDHRIRGYLSSPESYPLVVEDYYRRGLWREHGCRGATYLFLRWCVEQFGDGVLPRLIDGRAAGRRNLEMATGTPFEELFRRWSVALLESGRGAEDRYCSSLDLRGPLGNDCLLDGPRVHAWRPSSGPLELKLEGTSCAFVEIPASETPEMLRVSVQSEPGSELQVTLLRLEPEELSRGEIASRATDQATSK